MTEHSERAMRWKVIGVLAALLSVAPLFTTEARAAGEEPGQGFAFGQGFKVDPRAGGLSIGIAFGQSTAIHTNQVGRGVSTSTNFGVVGLTLGAQNCDGSKATWELNGKAAPEGQPEPLIVDSRDNGAAAGKTGADWGGAFTKQASATNTPFGEANTVVLGGSRPDPDPNRAFQMGNTLVRSYSGMVNGAREAGATVDLDYLRLGPVFISQLRWEATHRSTGTKRAEGHFSFGTMTFNGVTTPGSQDPAKNPNGKAAVDAVNAALKNLGLRFVPGGVRATTEGVVVDPLGLVVEPNPTRDGITQAIFTFKNPMNGTEVYKTTREALFKQILETRIPADNPNTPQNENEGGINGCRAGTYISVADIVMGSVTGAGDFTLSFGGVEATTAEIAKNSFNLTLPDFGTTPDIFIPGEPALESSFLGTPDIVSGPGVAFGPARVPTAPGTTTTRLVNPAASSRGPGQEPFKGARGGALAAVGLITLGVIAVVAETDRRKMRSLLRARAQEPGT